MTHLNQEVALTLKIEGEAFASWDGLDDMVVRRIADHFISDRALNLQQRVMDGIGDGVSKIVEARVQAFLDRKVTPVDRFGDPTGTPAKSLGELIADAADMAMAETVDPHDGKPKKRDSYSNAIPRADYLLKKLAKEAIATEVEKAVKAVNVSARAAVQAQVAAAIAARLAKA